MTKEKIDATIAVPNWTACNTCGNHGLSGCECPDIDIYLYLGDWIICKQYEKKRRLSHIDAPA
jgi:hypothetical protein